MAVVALKGWHRAILLGGVAACVWGGGAFGQAGSLDMDPAPAAPIAAGPTAPVAAASVAPAPAAPVTAGAAVANTPVVASLPDREPAHDTQPPGSIVERPAAVEPVHLDHPDIVNTAELKAGAATVRLFGIEGLSGEAAQGLQSYLASTDERLTCQAHDTTGSVCLLSDGTDLAQVALVNGAARTKSDAPASYKEQEAAAQEARRGIWVNLPPPPETVIHPAVPNTATLVAAGKQYPLNGLQGLGQPYTGQLQDYIAGNGDSLSCSLQGDSGNYICVSPDGTDIAKVALVNGAARVSPDAPDSYRVQQSDALNNRRGFWRNPPPDVMAAALAPQPDMYAFVAGDDGGADGVTYVGGAPVALIGGESVFLVYGDDAGWGYYDHGHHWHGAPDRYRAHMEHYHPYGEGLRGYRHDEAFHHEGGFHREDGFHHEAAYHHEEVGMHHDMARYHEEPMRHEAGIHPGGAGPGMMPGPGGHAGGFTHPGISGPVGHPGLAGGGARPGGGGFVHPGAMASAGGFHPGAAPAVPHAAPAIHTVAAVKHH